MKIIVKQDEQSAEYIINITEGLYPTNIREAIKIALELEGYHNDTIREIFDIMPDIK